MVWFKLTAVPTSSTRKVLMSGVTNLLELKKQGNVTNICLS